MCMYVAPCAFFPLSLALHAALGQCWFLRRVRVPRETVRLVSLSQLRTQRDCNELRPFVWRALLLLLLACGALLADAALVAVLVLGGWLADAPWSLLGVYAAWWLLALASCGVQASAFSHFLGSRVKRHAGIEHLLGNPVDYFRVPSNFVGVADDLALALYIAFANAAVLEPATQLALAVIGVRALWAGAWRVLLVLVCSRVSLVFLFAVAQRVLVHLVYEAGVKRQLCALASR